LILNHYAHQLADFVRSKELSIVPGYDAAFELATLRLKTLYFATFSL